MLVTPIPHTHANTLSNTKVSSPAFSFSSAPRRPRRRRHLLRHHYRALGGAAAAAAGRQPLCQRLGLPRCPEKHITVILYFYYLLLLFFVKGLVFHVALKHFIVFS